MARRRGRPAGFSGGGRAGVLRATRPVGHADEDSTAESHDTPAAGALPGITKITSV